MTDKELIKAEVVKSIEDIYNGRKFDDLSYQEQYALWWLKSINSFIDSLPEEPVSIPKDELQTWLKKQFKVSEKVMVRAERDWDRAYNNGEMTAYNNVISKVDSYDRQRKDIRLRY